MGNLIIVLVFWTVVGGSVGVAIGNGKGRKLAGFCLGFFFGPIGWIIIAVMDATPEAEIARMAAIGNIQDNANSSNRSQSIDTRNCPFCAEVIKAAAILCRFCGKDVEPVKKSASTKLHSSGETQSLNNTISTPSKTRWCANGHAVASGSVLCNFCGISTRQSRVDNSGPNSKSTTKSPPSGTRWCANGHAVASGSVLCNFCGIDL